MKLQKVWEQFKAPYFHILKKDFQVEFILTVLYKKQPGLSNAKQVKLPVWKVLVIWGRVIIQAQVDLPIKHTLAIASTRYL